MRFAFPNQIGQGCRTDQNLDRDHPPLTIGPYQQLLGNDAFERLCQHGADLALLFRRKDINEAVHCRGGGPRMQGAKDEMAYLSSGNGERNGFEVAQLPQ